MKIRSFLMTALAVSLALTIAAAQPAAESQPAPDPGIPWLTPLLNQFEFLPEYHLTGDLYFLALYKNDDYKKRYFVENNADLEFILASYHRRLYSSWGLYVRTTMGRQDGAIMFDPRELRYGIDPAVEVRFDRVNFRAGLDHYCFHEIDSWDGKTEYWNKAYLTAGSANARPVEYRKRLINGGLWDFESRFSYDVKLGHYLKRAFGLMDPAIIGGNHDYSWELTAVNRYALFKRLDWVVNARTLVNLNLARAGRLRQSYEAGFEGHLRRGAAGMMLFMNYHVIDQLTVRPKDRLLEIGLRFYN